MTTMTLQYKAQTSRAGYQRVNEALLLMGHLQNTLIRHRQSATSTHRHRFNRSRQAKHITDLHRHDPEFHPYARRLLEGTATRVNQSFSAFFKNPDIGRPTTKSPYHNQTLEISHPASPHIKLKEQKPATLHIKGLPKISFRHDSRMPSDRQPSVIRITMKPRRTVVSLVYDQEPQTIAEPTKHSVGIDPGVKYSVTAVSDDGAVLQIPGIDDSPHRKTKRRLARKMQRQRDAALKDGRARFVTQKVGDQPKRRFRWIDQPSKSYLRNLAQLRKVEQKRQDAQKGHQHQLSTQLVKTNQVICIEDTHTANMTRSAKGTAEQPGRNVAAKSGLNRAILAQGWYGLHQKLEYKCDWYRRQFVAIPAHHTSQRCSECGHVEAGNQVSQELFRCLSCGHQANADVNAAENIRRLGLSGIQARAGNLPGRAA